MEHAEAQTLRGAYSAGTLDREQVRAFHAHLKICELCQAGFRSGAVVANSQRRRNRGPQMPPEIAAQMAKNRSLLVKVLLLMGAAVLLLSRLR